MCQHLRVDDALAEMLTKENEDGTVEMGGELKSTSSAAMPFCIRKGS